METLLLFAGNVLPLLLFIGFALWFLMRLQKNKKTQEKFFEISKKSQATQEQIASTLLEIKQLLEKK